jgi:hypothetical protein
MSQPPSAEAQLEFLFRVQRILTEGAFVSTYKFALLLSLAELSVERADDTTADLDLDTVDIAEKFVEFYWRQVLPWVSPAGAAACLHQATGREAAILRLIGRAHESAGGSLPRFRAVRKDWMHLLGEIGRTIAIMPLWKLQTIGRVKDDFLYPNVGRGRVIRLRGDAVYCFRQFYTLIGDLVQTAWVRFIQRLPRNQPLLGQARDLRGFLFGSDRVALARFARVLRAYQDDRCFYCGRRVPGPAAVDHFIAWSRYPLDLGHNFVLADGACNSNKGDRLPAVEHLARWTSRNTDAALVAEFDREALPHDLSATTRVAGWAYEQAERVRGQLWIAGRDDLEFLPRDWRKRAGWVVGPRP